MSVVGPRRKASLSALAIAGGVPLFADPKHVGEPNIGGIEPVLQRVRGVLERRWLTNNGPLVQEFESAVAKECNVDHCIAVTNGTIGLQVAAKALGLTGEVIVPSFTFVATAHALAWIGLRPVFADIDSQTGNLDPAAVQDAFTPDTSGVVGVHLWGNPAPVQQLAEVCAARGVQVMFDAAQALGSRFRGVKVGGFGECEVLSFHATKIASSFEGGAVLTNNPMLAERIRQLINFGFAGYDQVEGMGINGKMHEASAAMGLESLAQLDATIASNRVNAAAYRDRLEPIVGIRMMAPTPGSLSNDHYVVALVDSDLASVSRDDLYVVLHAEGVLARRYFFPGVMRDRASRPQRQPEWPKIIRPTTEIFAELATQDFGQ